MSTMLNGQDHGTLTTDAASRLSHYYQLDNERQAFIQTMLQKIEADAKRIAELELDLEDQKKSRAQYQSISISLETNMQQITQKVSQDSFVVVLIDGDGAKFADCYLRDPLSGAEGASLRLKQAIRDNLRDTGLAHDDIPILVRVYANLNDLARSLRVSHIIDHEDDMRLFAEHFTNTRADFDFVNVGKGKENADSKMRRMLSHYARNIQCKKIFLVGCCHDNGYLHDLRDFTGVRDSKLVLVETTPAEPSFRKLGFPILRFDNVFRSEPLNNETKRVAQIMPSKTYSSPELLQPSPGPIARPTQPITKPPPGISVNVQELKTPLAPKDHISTPPTRTNSKIDESPVQAPSQLPSQPQPPVRTPSVISSGNGGTSISYATAGGAVDHQNVTVKAPKPKKQPKAIFYNSDNYRIDSPTQHPPKTPSQMSYQAKFRDIKPSVFCNDYYLKGRCKWGISCDKTHDVELTQPELAIHRYKARTSLCPAGPYCVDYDCYLSHHCPRVPCTRGDGCPFYLNEKWGDLHLNKEQLKPATKWVEGVDLPEHL